MKRPLRVILVLALVCGALYGSIFPLAEIFTEVVVLRTYDAEGVAHETRVTVIDIEGSSWVRGRPYRGWFRRIEADPALAFVSLMFGDASIMERFAGALGGRCTSGVHNGPARRRHAETR